MVVCCFHFSRFTTGTGTGHQGGSAYIPSFVTLHTARCISRSGGLKGSISGMRDVFLLSSAYKQLGYGLLWSSTWKIHTTVSKLFSVSLIYEHPGHTFQLAEHNILLCLLVLVPAKNILLILYVENMH